MNWRYRVDIGKSIRKAQDTSVTFEQAKRILMDALQEAAGELPSGMEEAFIGWAMDMEGATDEDEVDEILEQVYDFADEKRIWLGT